MDSQKLFFLTFIHKKNGGDCEALQWTWDAPHRVGLIIRRRQISYLIIDWHRFGLWKVSTEHTADIVYNAIKVGYRLFDGAFGMFKPVLMGLSFYILTWIRLRKRERGWPGSKTSYRWRARQAFRSIHHLQVVEYFPREGSCWVHNKGTAQMVGSRLLWPLPHPLPCCSRIRWPRRFLPFRLDQPPRKNRPIQSFHPGNLPSSRDSRR